MSETTEPVSVRNVPEKHRYEIWIGEGLAGFAQYRLPDDQHVDFVHTEIDPAYGRRGLAAQLVADALADVRAQGKRIIPHCPYVAKYLQKHPGYEDLVDWPQR
ncbi:GNAT family N-acetyltransferase [Aeromicrobium sp. CTD01-1L150]|uniref:GNAT family N-acetyltransferase n=1 Tax=Aeromicrobium sp. CTD01-1L150 TaxID=3341830 RepID=UPI0035BF9D76